MSTAKECMGKVGNWLGGLKGKVVGVAGAALLTLATFGTSAARADYYAYVPKTMHVVKYDCYGCPYTVCYTVYVRVLVRTGCY